MADNRNMSWLERLRRQQEQDEMERREQERREEERREQERREEERRKQELSEARSEKSKHENDLSEKESLRSSNNEKIERLQKVKTKLEEDKGVANGRYKELKKYSENDETFKDWYGSKCNTAKQTISGSIAPKYKDYVDNIDAALDAVCDEITRLQNENYQLDGAIGWLRSAINSLANRISTLLN